MNIAMFWHPELGLLLIRVEVEEDNEIVYYQPDEHATEMDAILYADWLNAQSFTFEPARNLN